jgi:hypothetical protein
MLNLRGRAVGAALATCIGATTIICVPGAGGVAMAQGDPRPPRVVEVHWWEGGDTLPNEGLSVRTRHTNSLKFVTRFDDERATAPFRGPPDRATDSHSRRAYEGNCGGSDPPCQSWEPIRGGGAANDVFRLIRQSLNDRGKAKIRVRARRNAKVDDVRITIVDAECHPEPIYPRTCIVDRHSNSLISD